ncbi:hypothetical protein GCM10027040_28980 [Halomonas shantousis]
MEWLNENSGSLNVIASFFTLVIWLFYAQLLYFNYARQRRPRILINRGRSKDINALCLISNMSSEAIFLEHIVAILHTSEGEIVRDLIEFERPGDYDKETDRLAETTQPGPLESGGFRHIGSFSDIIKRVAQSQRIRMREGRPLDDVQFFSLEIRIIAVYGSEDNPVGACRSFNLKDTEEDDAYELEPASFDTMRLASRRKRREVRRWIRDLPTV